MLAMSDGGNVLAMGDGGNLLDAAGLVELVRTQTIPTVLFVSTLFGIKLVDCLLSSVHFNEITLCWLIVGRASVIARHLLPNVRRPREWTRVATNVVWNLEFE